MEDFITVFKIEQSMKYKNGSYVRKRIQSYDCSLMYPHTKFGITSLKQYMGYALDSPLGLRSEDKVKAIVTQKQYVTLCNPKVVHTLNFGNPTSNI